MDKPFCPHAHILELPTSEPSPFGDCLFQAVKLCARFRKCCNQKRLEISEDRTTGAGTLSSLSYRSETVGGRGYLGPAATLADRRRQNLASALTCQAMNFFFEKGMNSVALHTSEQNVASITPLQGIGFMIGHCWKFMREDISQWSSQTSLLKGETD